MFFDYLEESSMTKALKDGLAEGKIPDNEFIRSIRHFEPLDFDRVFLSIQASYGHHSIPRVTFENPSIYTHMEVGIFSVEDGFIDVLKHERFKDFTELKELVECQSIPGVYSYAPVELIEKLFQYMIATCGNLEIILNKRGERNY
jgi:hypothetical protein